MASFADKAIFSDMVDSSWLFCNSGFDSTFTGITMEAQKRLDLKRDAQSLDYPGMRRRLRWTVEFMDKYADKGPIDHVLDIGSENDFGKELARSIGYNYQHTYGNLDFDWNLNFKGFEYEKPRYVTCFEVLEHLKNPDMFLRQLNSKILYGAIVFLSWPTHLCSCWWSPTHFHEYDEARAYELFAGSGFEVMVEDKQFIWPLLNGIRPILRALHPRSWAWQHFYAVRAINE